MVRRMAVVVVCGLASVLAGLPASVGVERGLPWGVVLRDGSGDVWEEDPAKDTITLIGDFPTVDVRRAAGRHLRRSVLVRMRFVDLRRIGRQQTQAAFIKTPDNLYLALLSSFPNQRAVRHSLEQWGPPAHGSTVRCEGFNHHIDYAGNVAQMRLPRSCLGNPCWVRLGMHNVLFKGGGLLAPTYSDNPHNDGTAAGQRILTRRLHRR